MQVNVNFNLYKSFIVAYEEKSFNKAANALGITREAIRQNIRELGNQLNVQLFTSHAKGVEPTDKAREIYPKIKDAIVALASIEKTQEQDTLKIAVSNSSIEIFLVAYLKEFYSKYPNITLDILKREGMELSDQKNLDFIVDTEHYIDKAHFKAIDIVLATDAFVVSKDFIKKNNIATNIIKEDLFKHPSISRKEVWEEFLQHNDIKNKPPFISVASMDMALPMVENSMGIGYFAKELLNIKPNTDLVALNVQDLDKTAVKYSCGYTKALSKHAKKFIDGFIKFCAQ